MASNKIRHPKKRAFLSALAKTGNVTKAAQASGIFRTTHYDWLQDDTDGSYAAAVKDAMAEAADLLEEEARRRAVEGWEEPVWYQGEQVGIVRKYDSTLLIFLLKGAWPEKYGRERHELTGKDGGAIQHQVRQSIDLSSLSDEELDTLDRLIDKTDPA